MEFLSTFFAYLTDKSKRLTHKATLVLSVIILLILADNILGFSYYYNIEKKITQIKEIHLILKDPGLSEVETKKLEDLKKDIMDRTSVKDYVYNLTANMTFSTEMQRPKAEPAFESESNPKEHIAERNYYWQVISSSWMWLLIAAFYPVILLTDKETSFLETLAGIVLFEPFIIVIIWLNTKAFSLIPVIFNIPVINYILNFALSILVIYLVNLYDINKRKQHNKVSRTIKAKADNH